MGPVAAMRAPLFAGFEGAWLHWNGHCTVAHTRHTAETDMAAHYREALHQGATGFRDVLPERFDVAARRSAARRAAPGAIICWSLTHWDQPRDPVRHAVAAVEGAGPLDRFIAVNEPSVGQAVSGWTADHALRMAIEMMDSAGSTNPYAQWWTCDPAHHCAPEVWRITDELVRAFGPAIEVVGCNYHAAHAGAPLRDVLRGASDRYPDQRIGLTETSWHDGHTGCEGRFPHIRSRAEWWDHVLGEIDASGVPLACATWMPWLDMAFEPGSVWPNGWRCHVPA